MLKNYSKLTDGITFLFLYPSHIIPALPWIIFSWNNIDILKNSWTGKIFADHLPISMLYRWGNEEYFSILPVILRWWNPRKRSECQCNLGGCFSLLGTQFRKLSVLGIMKRKNLYLINLLLLQKVSHIPWYD